MADRSVEVLLTGGSYVGNFGFDLMRQETPRTTGLVRLDPDGVVTPVAGGLLFRHGMVLTADGSTLVVAETPTGVFACMLGRRPR